VSSVPRADVEAEVRLLVERLVQRFSGDLDPQLIESTVRLQAARFTHARVTRFVPLFVERYSVQELTDMISTEQQRDPLRV
jgi:hypothetical protein